MSNSKREWPISSLTFLSRESDSANLRSGANRLLRREPIFDTDTFTSGGLEIVRNPDPILRYVAPKGDESQWRSMERSNDKLAACKEHRLSLLIGDGTRLVVGDAKDEVANRNYDFTLSAFKGIYGWNTALAKVWDAVVWGWRPLEAVWTNDFKWNGKTYWAVKKIKEKAPWNYAFTADGMLARKPVAGNPNYEIVNKGINKLNWLIASAGGNDTPYGEAWYQNIYLITYAKDRFFQMFTQGMERSMGIIKVTESVGATQAADDSPEAMARIIDEVRDIVDVLAANNILIQRGRLAVELLDNIKYADGWLKALDYCDNCITLLMLGQNLSMQVGAKGSYAAVDAQIESVAKKFVKRDAKVVTNVINDQLIPHMLEMNFGKQDSSVMPRVRFEVENELNLEATRILFDMGATIDVAAVGKKLGVPVVPEGEPEARGAIHLKKPDPPVVAPGGGQTGPAPTKDIDERNDKKAKDDRTNTPKSRAAVEDPPEGAEATLKEFWKENARKYLESSDPFP